MAGYSKTPLVQKLGLKPGMRAAFLRAPESVAASLEPLPENISLLKAAAKEMDYIHFFAESVADLEKHFAALKKSLAKTGTLWISWRKGKNNTDLSDHDVRRIALEHGLVDVKVCAVDETWSGLKLVYRLKDR
jgi:hypothetical protein